MEDSGGAANFSGVRREAGFDPGAKSSIEKINIFRSEGSEGPPCSRCREDSFLLIDDDVLLIRYAESRHVSGKLVGRRQHVGQRIGAVGERFDIKEDCARNVLCEVARARIHRRYNTDRGKRRIQI